jgi:hypothetical protein
MAWSSGEPPQFSRRYGVTTVTAPPGGGARRSEPCILSRFMAPGAPGPDADTPALPAPVDLNCRAPGPVTDVTHQHVDGGDNHDAASGGR